MREMATLLSRVVCMCAAAHVARCDGVVDTCEIMDVWIWRFSNHDSDLARGSKAGVPLLCVHMCDGPDDV